MENALDIASSAILQPVGLQHSDMDKVLAALGGSAIDAADIYFQSSWLESWSLEDGIIKEGNYSIERGAGIRAISGEKTGFAYVDDIELPQLINSATTARAIASAGSSHRV
ncbi:MAG: metalloprotease TldD, partial [gamma proteobacterium symbiont of Bathyaustriella thionipta]|nr:metalloprotease TldD [gamma proteobacterium symbiont of Bathyaustriella thionipta]